jgi:hypothetical protein
MIKPHGGDTSFGRKAHDTLIEVDGGRAKRNTERSRNIPDPRLRRCGTIALDDRRELVEAIGGLAGLAQHLAPAGIPDSRLGVVLIA